MTVKGMAAPDRLTPAFGPWGDVGHHLSHADDASWPVSRRVDQGGSLPSSVSTGRGGGGRGATTSGRGIMGTEDRAAAISLATKGVISTASAPSKSFVLFLKSFVEVSWTTSYTTTKTTTKD